jgi:hypothetical protein
MPTRGRPHLAPQAIEQWRAQDYPNRELVIVDDADRPSFRQTPCEPGIAYVRTRRPSSLGAKRNLCCARASGELLAHWDDDDWYGPAHLTTLYEFLDFTGAEIVGYHTMEFRDGECRHQYVPPYQDPDGMYAIGASLMYRRRFWERNPFPDVDRAEDGLFVERARDLRVLRSRPADGLMWASIHEGNTSRRNLAAAQYRRIA